MRENVNIGWSSTALWRHFGIIYGRLVSFVHTSFGLRSSVRLTGGSRVCRALVWRGYNAYFCLSVFHCAGYHIQKRKMQFLRD